jgi:DNA-binding GntR family transcriptional regulator
LILSTLLPSQVVVPLERAVLSRRLHPLENQLAARLGVSRQVIREALVQALPRPT